MSGIEEAIEIEASFPKLGEGYNSIEKRATDGSVFKSFDEEGLITRRDHSGKHAVDKWEYGKSGEYLKKSYSAESSVSTAGLPMVSAGLGTSIEKKTEHSSSIQYDIYVAKIPTHEKEVKKYSEDNIKKTALEHLKNNLEQFKIYFGHKYVKKYVYGKELRIAFSSSSKNEENSKKIKAHFSAIFKAIKAEGSGKTEKDFKKEIEIGSFKLAYGGFKFTAEMCAALEKKNHFLLMKLFYEADTVGDYILFDPEYSDYDDCLGEEVFLLKEMPKIIMETLMQPITKQKNSIEDCISFLSSIEKNRNIKYETKQESLKKLVSDGLEHARELDGLIKYFKKDIHLNSEDLMSLLRKYNPKYEKASGSLSLTAREDICRALLEIINEHVFKQISELRRWEDKLVGEMYCEIWNSSTSDPKFKLPFEKGTLYVVLEDPKTGAENKEFNETTIVSIKPKKYPKASEYACDSVRIGAERPHQYKGILLDKTYRLSIKINEKNIEKSGCALLVVIKGRGELAKLTEEHHAKYNIRVRNLVSLSENLSGILKEKPELRRKSSLTLKEASSTAGVSTSQISSTLSSSSSLPTQLPFQFSRNSRRSYFPVQEDKKEEDSEKALQEVLAESYDFYEKEQDRDTVRAIRELHNQKKHKEKSQGDFTTPSLPGSILISSPLGEDFDEGDQEQEQNDWNEGVPISNLSKQLPTQIHQPEAAKEPKVTSKGNELLILHSTDQIKGKAASSSSLAPPIALSTPNDTSELSEEFDGVSFESNILNSSRSSSSHASTSS